MLLVLSFALVVLSHSTHAHTKQPNEPNKMRAELKWLIVDWQLQNIAAFCYASQIKIAVY